MKLFKYKKDGYARRLTLCGIKFSWKGKNAIREIKQPFSDRYFTELG